MNKIDYPIIISLFLIAFLIRVTGVENVAMDWDEPGYLILVYEILANNWVPTEEVFLVMSPLLPYIGAGVTLLFEGDLNTLRMISVIFGSFTVPLLYLFGNAMYDRKTGVLAALFLCFSTYHSLYSRLFKLEAFTLFFIVAFLYFFWMSQCSDDRKNTTYAIIAGMMLGLAIAAKYLPAFLVPAVLIYAFWTAGFNIKVLKDKKIMLVLIFALLFFSPMVVCWFYSGAGLNQVYFYTKDKFEKEEGSIGTVRAGSMPPDQLFIKGTEKITEILSWGAMILSPNLAYIFKISVISLFFMTHFSFMYNFKDREEKGSFLTICILSSYIFLLGFCATKYYLIYSFPLYFVMLSRLTIKSFDSIKNENNYKNTFRIFIILLTAVMLLFYLITSVTSPYWDEGEHSWASSTVNFIKSDAIKGGYTNDILIGKAVPNPMLDYSICLSDLNASTLNIIKPGAESIKEVTIDLETINRVKPDYLVVSESAYDLLFKNNIKKEIFKNYSIIFHTKTHSFFNSIILKKKDMQPIEFLLPMDTKDGKITQDIFNRSVPSVMKVGKVYTGIVQVENTGDSRRSFYVDVYSNQYAIFVEEPHRELTIDKGSTCILKFKIIPYVEYVGEIQLTVDLYTKYEENELYTDSFSDYVYRLI